MFKNAKGKGRVLVAALLITYGVFQPNIKDIYLSITPSIVLDIETPNQDVLNAVTPIANIITDKDDRDKFAIFNYEFANRVKDYSANLQQVNDVYTLAGKVFFKNEMVGKYDGLSDSLIKLISDLVSDDNHDLSQIENNKLSEYFMGLSWVLTQRQ